MAHVASNSTNIATTPFMDRLTHAVIKETSKNLKYYIDIKRRENAFVLNSTSPLYDSTSQKTKFPYGTAREHASIYSSYYPDKDMSNFLPKFQQKQKQQIPSITSPEKQMCREELNFHMRSYNFSPREGSKLFESRVKPTTRSTSSCGAHRDSRSRTSFRLTRHEKDQLIDDAADILASMVKSRRPTHQINTSLQPTPTLYISPNANISPRQQDDHSNVQSSASYPITDFRLLSLKEKSQREKRITQDPFAKTTYSLQKTKLITKGFLCEYKISITTGDCNGASTNAPIRIKLWGVNGHTNFHELLHSEMHRIPFLKDQTDMFTLKTYHVGELSGITIGHDRKDMRASWYLSKVSINDPIRHKTYNISCNSWLSIKAADQKTMRDFPVASVTSHTKAIISDEHREEHESQSDYSTRTGEGTTSSNETNPSENISSIDNKQTKKYRKQQHVSIGPTTIARPFLSSYPNTNNSSQLPPSSSEPTTIETHFNQDDLLFPPIVPRIHSATFSATSSDTEIESTMTNQTRSRSRTPSPTFHQQRLQPVSEYDTLQTKSTSSMLKQQSLDHDRPPARLEKRNSPLSMSPEQPHKTNGENNENNPFLFIE